MKTKFKNYKLITVTTDFGDQFAAAQLKAIVACLGYRGEIIENHSVTPFSVTEGSFQITLIARFSPAGSIHLGVIDPGVGSHRRAIIIRTNRSWFVGPDNGLFSPVLEKEAVTGVWQIREEKISESYSYTFHGRDIFIKAAVFIAQGKNPEEFGCSGIDPSSLEKISFQTGQVLHIDYFGNIKVYWPGEIKIGKKLKVNTKKTTIDTPVPSLRFAPFSDGVLC